jgi:hypothetical protein
MSARTTCWGIYREVAHSPGRIDDDAAIMKRVADALTARNFAVELLPADAVDAALEAPGANIFAMCEGRENLRRLEIATSAGAIVVNSPNAIGNTYRHRMVELFAQHGVPAPRSQVVSTDLSTPPPAARVWVKRYDFHATQAEDVIYAASEDGWREALGRFAGRGIPFVIVQDHVPGDLVKFYGVTGGAAGVAGTDWFEWFYHRDKAMIGYPFDAARLRDVARGAAAALCVEIFGGDAIIRPDGEPVIVDLNAWPSYALFREQAAHAIADHLADRFRRRVRAVPATELIHG